MSVVKRVLSCVIFLYVGRMGRIVKICRLPVTVLGVARSALKCEGLV